MSSTMTEWYAKRSDRLEVEGRLLKRRYPQAALVKKNAQMRVRINLRGKRDMYECELIYPSRFPYEEIDVFIRSPKLEESPHRYSKTQVCVNHGDWGPQTTAIVYIDWLRKWIDRYENYLKTGRWKD